MKKFFCAALLFVALGFTNSTQAQDAMIGEVKLFAGNFAPRGWAKCEGQLLAISQHTALFSILGTTYGGDGRTTFALPDLRGRVPVSSGTGPGMDSIKLGQKSGGRAVNSDKATSNIKTQPTLGMHYIIALQGVYPSRS
ncbi:phage tail protein [Winogradskyella litorisediminis]|uniref:Phage tail protein n=1 Tax=Winogradskyella litorisediminis TaxID=1156618 RepID=A0ABW3NA36_9FLAO